MQVTEKKYYGVSKLSSGGWGVTISIEGKSVWLGTFPEDQQLQAAKTYDIYRVYYNHQLKAQKLTKRTFPTNNLLSSEEITNIETNGLPEEYQRANLITIKPLADLPKGITRRGSNFRVCIQSKGRKFEKVFDSLEQALRAKDQQLVFWSQ